MAKKRKSSRKAPWNRPAPRKAKHTKLSSKGKAAAKRRAKKAGRPYPNLVDNMREARKKK
jgi:hypothetical protein